MFKRNQIDSIKELDDRRKLTLCTAGSIIVCYYNFRVLTNDSLLGACKAKNGSYTTELSSNHRKIGRAAFLILSCSILYHDTWYVDAMSDKGHIRIFARDDFELFSSAQR